MADPVHQSILLADIEGSGGSDDVVRRVRRRHMYEAVNYALEAAEAGPADHRMEDRGDGVMVLVRATVSKARLLRAVLTEIPARLHAYNRIAAESARVRLRVVLAAGEVALDEVPGVLGGAVGWDLDQAFRLLDGDPLREALRRRRGTPGGQEDALLCVSDAVYQGVVRHDHRGIRRDAFHAITVAAKEGPVRGWVYGDVAPQHREPERQGAEESASGAPATAEERGGGGSPAEPGAATAGSLGTGASFSGNYVAGDMHGVSGGHVAGDVVMGSKIVGGDPRGGERR